MQDRFTTEESRIAVIGGDLRQLYLAILLSKQGYPVTVYGNHPELYDLTKDDIDYYNEHIQTVDLLTNAVKSHSILILPTPLSKDGEHITTKSPEESISLSNFLSMLTHKPVVIGGAINPKITAFFVDHSIPFHDLMKLDTVAIGNSIATAEGTILEAIKRSQTNLHGSSVLVVGFGRCAKILAQKLKGLDANVTVAARRPDAIAYANAYGFKTQKLPDVLTNLNQYDYIFNTVPVKLFIYDALLTTKSDVTIIDIASAPGGVDYDAAKTLGRNVSLCLGLPGIYAPRASAAILLQPIIDILSS